MRLIKGIEKQNVDKLLICRYNRHKQITCRFFNVFSTRFIYMSNTYT